jgi:hypothetical protein
MVALDILEDALTQAESEHVRVSEPVAAAAAVGDGA